MTIKPPTGPIKIDPRVLHLTDETATILQTAQAYVEADIAVAHGSMALHILAQKATFARVGVKASEGGGYYLILKRVNGIWVTIVSAQDLPGKDTGKKYGLPEGWFSTEY